MLFQTGSQENGGRAFQGRRIFRKSSSNLAAVWWWEEYLVFLALWSGIAWSLQAHLISFRLQCQRCSQNLLDCGTEHFAVSQEQPTASLHGWIFIFIFFVTLSTWDLHFQPPCIPVLACIWLYGNAVAEEPHSQCWGGVSGVAICPSLNKFH